MKYGAPFRFVGLCWLIVITISSAPAWAAPPKRIGLVPFSGPSGKKVQALVTKAIASHGFRVILEPDGPAPDDAPSEDAAARTVAAESNLVGIVSGVVVGRGKKLSATVYLRDWEDGSVVKQQTWSSRKGVGPLLRAVKKGAWPAFAEALRSLRPRGKAGADVPSARPAEEIALPPPILDEPAAAPAPAPEASPPPPVARRRRAPVAEEEVEESRAPAAPSGPAAVEIVIGPRMSLRSFTYRNVLGPPLDEFRTSRPSAELGFAARWFPKLTGVRLGAAIDGQYGARVQAATEDGAIYQLSTNELTGMAVVGLPLDSMAIDLGLGGGIHDSKMTAEEGAAARPKPVPDIGYGFLRAGLGFHLYTDSPFSLSAGAYYRHLVTIGEIASDSWFPNLSVWGFDAALGLSYRIAPWIEARLQGDTRFYRFSMHATEGDPKVAGGAIDQYWGAMLGVAGVFGATARP